MDDPEGGGTPPRSSEGGGTPPTDSAGWWNSPSTSRPSNSNPGKLDPSIKSKKSNNKTLATLKQYEEYSSLFKPESYYDKHFIIEAINKRILSEIDTIKANDDLEKHLGGSPNNIRELKSGGILVEVRTKAQSTGHYKPQTTSRC